MFGVPAHDDGPRPRAVGLIGVAAVRGVSHAVCIRIDASAASSELPLAVLASLRPGAR
jgi:hypothetical protein